MPDAIKGYANAALAVVVLVLISGALIERWYHGEARFKAGKDEVHAAWDKDKAERKVAADQQAKDTFDKNKGNKNALIKSQADLRDARSNLNVVLKRLRDLPALSGGEGLSMAGRGGAAVPGVAEDSSQTGGGVEQRIGGCEDSSSEPCFVGRGFFDQAVKDAADRALTREWAKGQGIEVEGSAQHVR